MNDALFFIDQFAVKPSHLLVASFALLILLAVLGLFTLMVQSRARRREAEHAAFQAQELEERLAEVNRIQAEMTGRMATIAEVFGSRQSEMTKAFSERLDGMSHRLGQSLEAQTRGTLDNLGKLNERLAVIDTAQKNLTTLASEVVSLRDVLSNKQARGAFGQGRMEAILADSLPKGSYDLQFTLSNGKRPDAVIRLPGDERVLVIDAKFPLEAITQWRDAKGPDEKKQAFARVKGDMVRHVSDIAERYLLPGETQETALLFVPAESIYADLHEHFDEVIQRAYRTRVVIVSPSLLVLSIQVIQGLMKDERMRQEAHVIRTEVAHLLDDVGRLRDRVANLQRHFGQANDDLTQIMVSADKISKRGAKIESLEFEEAPALVQPVLPVGGLLKAGE